MTERYIVKLAPVVWSYKRNEAVPIYIMYQDLMEELDGDDERARKYRRELLGVDMILNANDEYWEIGLSKEVAASYSSWRKMPIHDRAKVKAWAFLKNCADILERHQENMEKKRKQLLDDIESKRKTPSRASRGGGRRR